jgi:hypothetical protein
MSERPIFVADHGRRATLIHLFARATAAAGGLWLIALLAGAFGLGRLPAVPFPPLGAIHEHTPSSEGRPAKHDAAPSAAAASQAAATKSETEGTGTGPDHTEKRPARPARDRRQRRLRAPTSDAPRALPTQTPASATPATPTKTTTPRGRERAPAYTPSGNEVAAGTTGPGTKDPLPSSASGWWRKR